MAVVFRPAGEPAADLAESWRELLHSTIGPLEPHGVPDEVRAGDLGAVRVAALSQCDPGGARRTARHVRRSDSELYKVDVLVRGRGVIEQDGRQAVLEPGDFAFVDLGRPARWTSASAKIVAISFPRELLPLHADRLTGVRLPGDKGLGALVSTLARRLPGQLDGDAPRLGAALFDLLTSVLGARAGQPVPLEIRRRTLLLQAQAFIDAHLGDPGLTPRMVAAAQFISLRYLHKLFEAEETTVAEWIRRQRLERCRRDLTDPRLRTEPVHAIAARWGLMSAAHFSRVFRAAYGLPPAEYRLHG